MSRPWSVTQRPLPTQPLPGHWPQTVCVSLAGCKQTQPTYYGIEDDSGAYRGLSTTWQDLRTLQMIPDTNCWYSWIELRSAESFALVCQHQARLHVRLQKWGGTVSASGLIRAWVTHCKISLCARQPAALLATNSVGGEERENELPRPSLAPFCEASLWFWCTRWQQSAAEQHPAPRHENWRHVDQ